jgi:hypothetical protein
LQVKFHYRSKWSEHVDRMEKNYIPDRDLNYDPQGTRNIEITIKEGIFKGYLNRDITDYCNML